MEQKIAKILKKYPFIYYINGRYYAIGTGVCAEHSPNLYPTLDIRFNDYLEALNAEISDDEAWSIFRWVITMAKPNSDEEGEICPVTELENKLIQFGFSGEDMKELNSQLDRYEEFWKRHHLEKFINH